MKQIYFLLFAALFTYGKAQIITQSFNEPIVGDIDKSYRLDTSSYTSGLPVSTTGSNCVWNYANLTGMFPMVVDSFVAPSAVASSTGYPGTSYVQHRDLLYTFYKSTSSPQQTELLGAYSPSLSLTFTNSAIIATYPLNYGYNQADPVSGSFKYNSTPGACVGNITISADGLGTLNLPNNVSFPNVLCLRSVEILTLSTGIVSIGTFNQIIYNYYAPGKKFPVLNINYTTYQLIGNQPNTTAYVYGNSSYFNVLGINESQLNRENYEVYPNPFHDRLFVKTKITSEENEYLLYDCNGSLIFKTTTLNEIETRELSSGIYILEIKNRLGSYHQKVIKE